MSTWLRLLAAALLAIPALACGPSGPRTYDVSGTVTVSRSTPLAEGMILFEPEHTYGPDTGPIKDGQFRLRVKEGKHKVRITADRPVAGTKDFYGQPLRQNFIDPRFNSQTELTAEVGEGRTTFAFDVRPQKR